MQKLDRSIFSIKTFEEADDDARYWASLSMKEVFEISWQLTCNTYGIDPENSIRMDRTAFEIIKRD